jgi:hypothetical protein
MLQLKPGMGMAAMFPSEDDHNRNDHIVTKSSVKHCSYAYIDLFLQQMISQHL